MQAPTIFSACRARLSPRSPSLVRSLFQSSKTDPALSDLPDKVAFKTGPLGRASSLLPPRVSNKITTRVGSSFGGDHSLEWISRPRNVLIVKKRTSRRATEALTNVVRHIRTTYPYMNIILEESVQKELYGRVDGPITIARNDEKALLAAKTDFVITLGGDGTILHTSSIFDRDAVPPVLSFSMGTLGFLLPYSIGALGPALDELVSSRISLLLRMRLSMIVSEKSSQSHSDEIHLMNEVAIHRGREPHMTRVDAFVDGRHLTQAISDGLIISTPTGSTAYSLSAGGPIVHPSVQSLVLTPICPRSLSFRTVLLPSDSSVQLKLSTRSRSSASLTVDGRELRTLSPGDSLSVRMSPFPIPCVNCSTSTWEGSAVHADPDPPAPHTSFSESLPFPPQSPQAADLSNSEATSSQLAGPRRRDHWVRDVNTLLKFNASFSGRGSLGGHEDGDEADEEDLTAPPSPFLHREEHQ